jgi:nucleoside-diphosphate-sugar epimerase
MLSKVYGEAACHYAELPFTIVRPHNIYGPRMGLSHVVPELLQRVYGADEGGTLEVFSPRHQRTFCYVDDAVELIRRAAESDACEGETLNVGAEEPEIAIVELAQLIAAVVGKQLKIVPGGDTAGSPPRRRPDMKRTRSLTGFEPVISLREGIERTYEWYRVNVFEGSGVSAR